MYVYRYHNSQNPVGDYGYHFWASDPNKTGLQYGRYRFRLDVSDAIHVSDIIDDITSLLAEDYADGTLPCALDELLDRYSANDIAHELNPDNIVDSGGSWDNPDLVCWMYDRYFSGRGISTILTDDGAISFLPANDPHIEFLGAE